MGASPGQGPADLGPSGSLQLSVRAVLLEGELGTESPQAKAQLQPPKAGASRAGRILNQ